MSRIHVLALALGLTLLPTLALADESAEAGLEQVLVESASTPKQHEALAKYYTEKAKAERAQAAEHKQMATAYGGAKMVIAQAQKEHCEKLAQAHEAAAKEYDAMASEHESLAKK